MMIANNSGAVKRLRKELLLLERASKSKVKSAPEHDDIYLRPTSPESILRWTALIRGPPDTPYEGGIFQLNIKVGGDYPLAPPTITFETKVRLFYTDKFCPTHLQLFYYGAK
mmetsp:Transcript_5875/g.8641  ORF Transcript_5875/g.8641 Transcript_5875/m.8641 type:complete len:112 (+) Transcript_5875:57-392(+)